MYIGKQHVAIHQFIQPISSLESQDRISCLPPSIHQSGGGLKGVMSRLSPSSSPLLSLLYPYLFKGPHTQSLLKRIIRYVFFLQTLHPPPSLGPSMLSINISLALKQGWAGQISFSRGPLIIPNGEIGGYYAEF